MSDVRVYLELADRRLQVAAGETTVGRSQRCDLVIPDPGMSRTHALLSVAGGRVRLQDLDSSNGTFVNGERLRGEAEVTNGDEILLGETRMILRLQEGEAAPAPAAERRLADAPSRSEALAVGDVLPVGEILASPTDSWEVTGPIPLDRLEERAGAAAVAPPAAAPPAAVPASPTGPSPAVTGPRPEAPAPVPDPGRRPPGEVLPSLDDLDEQLGLTPLRRPPAPSPSPPAASATLAPAGFWRRAAAVFADGTLISLVALAAAFAAGGPVDRVGGGVGSAVLGALALLVPVVGWSRWGTTPGKRLLGLYVCTLGGGVGVGLGRALARWAGYVVSAAPLGLGFLMAAVTADRRALHDRIAGTYVGVRR